jgi:hypothetical protein
MSNKKTSVELNGKTIALDFGSFYFYKYFKDATSIDLYAAAFELAQKADSRKKEIEAATHKNIPIPEENGNSITETRLYKMITTTEKPLYAAGLIYAGYASDKSINKEKIELSFEDIQHEVYCLSTTGVDELIDVYNKINLEEAVESGEAGSHPS